MNSIITYCRRSSSRLVNLLFNQFLHERKSKRKLKGLIKIVLNITGTVSDNPCENGGLIQVCAARNVTMLKNMHVTTFLKRYSWIEIGDD